MGPFLCVAFSRKDSVHRCAAEQAPKRAQDKHDSAGWL